MVFILEYPSNKMKKIKEILKSIDANQITNILKDIRGTK